MRTVLALALPIAAAGAAETPAPPPRLRAEVLAAYPHDPQAFTQGLLVDGGALLESTGLYGRSSLRRVDVETGRIDRRVDLPATLFGEGLALANGRLVQLTWREGRALLYDPATLSKTGELPLAGEGWGLCFDGSQLVMSDGSHRLYFRDPTTFAVTRQLAVTMQGQPVPNLNELECVGESIYANVWRTDRIVEISKLNGTVRAVIDASGLLTPAERTALGPEAILNGIAHDPQTGTFLVTGKLWPKLFRVRFTP